MYTACKWNKGALECADKTSVSLHGCALFAMMV